MAKLSKRRKLIQEKVEAGKQYGVEEALQLLKELPRAKFVESVDVAVNLGVDPRKSDQVVRKDGSGRRICAGGQCHRGPGGWSRCGGNGGSRGIHQEG